MASSSVAAAKTRAASCRPTSSFPQNTTYLKHAWLGSRGRWPRETRSWYASSTQLSKNLHL
jgi:hypothetical protein